MKENISYNLSGYGKVNVQLYEYTLEVCNLLEKFGHIERLRRINQLGPLRRVYPGAHHTKYEYLIAQLSIVTELCNIKGVQEKEFRLGTDAKEFGRIQSLGDLPTRGEVLQVLILMGSIGHLPGTFASERAFLHWLRNNRQDRVAFKKGLPSDVETLFQEALRNFDIFRINLLISLFLINRYRRAEKGNEIVDFCISVLKGYIFNNDGGSNLRLIWSLYESIRKLSYLSLDSLYTEVPFSLDLSSIFLSLGDYREQVLSGQSGFQEALDLLEEVVRDSIYMSPKSILQEASTSEKMTEYFGSIDTEGNISGMREVIEPNKSIDAKIDENIQKEESYSNEQRLISLNFDKEKKVEKEVFENRDMVSWERKKRRRAGKSYSRFGAAWDPTRKHLRVVSAIRDRGSKTEEEKAFRIANQIAKAEINISDKVELGEAKKNKNKYEIMKFICKSMWGWEKKIHFRGPIVSGENPIYSTYGIKTMSDKIYEYKSKLEDKSYDEYMIHEAKLTAKNLSQVSYRGLCISYGGSLVVSGRMEEIAEFDGITFFLGNESFGRRVIIVEANDVSGHNDKEAENKLVKKSEALGIDTNRTGISMYEEGAVMSIFK